MKYVGSMIILAPGWTYLAWGDIFGATVGTGPARNTPHSAGRLSTTSVVCISLSDAFGKWMEISIDISRCCHHAWAFST